MQHKMVVEVVVVVVVRFCHLVFAEEMKTRGGLSTKGYSTSDSAKNWRKFTGLTKGIKRWSLKLLVCREFVNGLLNNLSLGRKP